MASLSKQTGAEVLAFLCLDMLDYMFLGLLCLVLPNHRSWLGRDVP